MAAGVPDELFWELSPLELDELFAEIQKVERWKNIRAGTIAAQILNVHRTKGAPLKTWRDFFREPPREEDFMQPDAAVAIMDLWAAEQNSRGAS